MSTRPRYNSPRLETRLIKVIYINYILFDNTMNTVPDIRTLLYLRVITIIVQRVAFFEIQFAEFILPGTSPYPVLVVSVLVDEKSPLPLPEDVPVPELVLSLPSTQRLSEQE